MAHPTKEELERFDKDCNRDGLCHFDMESAIRNNIVPSMYTPDEWEMIRQPHGKKNRS